MKCLALFSGGLDSLLAIKIIEEQGIEVIPLFFYSYFFGFEREYFSKRFGFSPELIDISDEHLKIVYNPLYGYGKNINPCIDCHALMLKKAGVLLEKYNAKFIITGEILGQRPMSQNKKAFQIIDKITGLKGLILRPLTAKNLDITIPEEKGWVDRERLLDIKGRERKVQLELVKKYNITYYSKPGGGCILTIPSFKERVVALKNDNVYNPDILKAIRSGRFLRLDRMRYIIVSRNEIEGKKLKEVKGFDIFIEPYDKPGPNIVYFGEVNQYVIDLCKYIFLYYAKVDDAYIYLNNEIVYAKREKDYDFKKYIL